MRKKCIATLVPAVFAAAVLASTDASAVTKVTISGTWSRGQIKKDCDAVGGVYSDTHAYGYGCLNGNNGNTVSCNNRGKCTGTIARQGRPRHTISGILHSPSAGIKSTGSYAPSEGRRHTAKITGFGPPSKVKSFDSNAPVIYRTGEHHFGGRQK